MEKVVNRRLDKNLETLYIGRGSKWGNPFTVGEHGKRGECVKLYKHWITRGKGRPLLRDLFELEGETLGCYCAPKGGLTHADHMICHGVVLLRLLEHARQKRAEKLNKNNAA